jgi:hypothetical protein
MYINIYIRIYACIITYDQMDVISTWLPNAISDREWTLQYSLRLFIYVLTHLREYSLVICVTLDTYHNTSVYELLIE